jgi:RES domain-containing protein
MVYTSDSLALVALELLTQLNDSSLLPKFVALSAEFPDDLVSELDLSKLPANWRSHPAPPELQLLGDTWAKTETSLALRVPSAVVAQQHNYLINPAHPSLPVLKVSPPEPFDFDLRLLPKFRAGGDQ